MTSSVEHPFAQYVRILGKGRNGMRNLTQAEARTAMSMIIEDKVEAMQLGAFLMLMRVKEETAEELAGFIQGVRDSFQLPLGNTQVDLDWSSYAGKRRHLPWFVLSTLLLAKSGIKIFMHGTSGHTAGRIYTQEVLPMLGLKHATSLEEAIGQIEKDNFSYLPLDYLCPKLQQLIELRNLLGLRSPVNTIARMLNPLNAPYMIQGIYHPSYRQIHQKAALILGQPHLAVLKGEGGESERDPDIECLVQSVHDGQLIDEIWSPLFSQRHLKEDDMQPERLAAVWRGEMKDEFAQGAVIGTAAIALRLLGKADSPEHAIEIARNLWEKRSV